jgi:hypothetical protein
VKTVEAMDPSRFDATLRRFAASAGRRDAVRSLTALGLGALAGLAGLGTGAAASTRKKRQRCRGKKIRCGRGCCKTNGSRPDCCPTRKSKVCTNLATDPANCGACGITCDEGKVCAGGLCWLPCPEASGCFGAKLCEGGNLCVAVDGVAVCAVSATCDQLTGCTIDPAACPAGTTCAAICCGADANTCRTPVS